jgi:hypothetical protein
MILYREGNTFFGQLKRQKHIGRWRIRTQRLRLSTVAYSTQTM